MCLCVQLYAAVSTTGIAFIHNLIIPNNGNIKNSTIRDVYVFNSLGERSGYLSLNFSATSWFLLHAGYVQKLKKLGDSSSFYNLKFV